MQSFAPYCAKAFYYRPNIMWALKLNGLLISQGVEQTLKTWRERRKIAKIQNIETLLVVGFDLLFAYRFY